MLETQKKWYVPCIQIDPQPCTVEEWVAVLATVGVDEVLVIGVEILARSERSVCAAPCPGCMRREACAQHKSI
jgi:hypothetical protein